jgi:hypothetical protein
VPPQWFAGSSRRLKKLLDDLDIDIRQAQSADCTDSQHTVEGCLDVDALASSKERRLIIGLHLDSWTWAEINRHLGCVANGRIANGLGRVTTAFGAMLRRRMSDG